MCVPLNKASGRVNTHGVIARTGPRIRMLSNIRTTTEVACIVLLPPATTAAIIADTPTGSCGREGVASFTSAVCREGLLRSTAPTGGGDIR